MTKEQPDLFHRPETPEEEILGEPSAPKETFKQIQKERGQRSKDKKTAKDALAAGRRKIVGETRDGQKELFRE